jgi:hypothetical protein
MRGLPYGGFFSHLSSASLHLLHALLCASRIVSGRLNPGLPVANPFAASNAERSIAPAAPGPMIAHPTNAQITATADLLNIDRSRLMCRAVCSC